jgi:hypothetical protein
MLLLHSEVRAAVLDEHVIFFETAFVKEQGEPLAGSHLSFLMLGIDPFLASAQAGGFTSGDQFFDVFLLDAHIVS